MDQRKRWRTQEQELVARWNSAVTRHREALAEIAGAGNPSTKEALIFKAKAARAEVDALRREVARLKVEFANGRRY